MNMDQDELELEAALEAFATMFVGQTDRQRVMKEEYK
jgi:hypothetical protein